MIFEWLWVVLIAVLVFLIVRRFVGPKDLTALPQEDFIKGYRKAQLIDVREPKEYDGGHILGARNIPVSQMKQRMVEIREDQPVYLYCQSGMRSKQAAKLIKKHKGNRDIYHLQGGFKRWTGKISKKKKSA